MFNPHHLELFYYVAKHGGISAASRHIPYGLGQPAISEQITALEKHLGQKLFARKPFRLTEAGRKLDAGIKPLFASLPRLEAELKGGPRQVVRIAIDDLIGPAGLPAFLAASTPFSRDTVWEFPSAPSGELEKMLRERDVHLAITSTPVRLRGIRSLVLARPRPCLLVPRKSKITSPGHFWRQASIAERLICPLGASAVRQSFERGLQGLHVTWPATVQVASHALMLSLVAQGQGIGLSVELPPPDLFPAIRSLPLTHFDPVPVLALWCGTAPSWFNSLLAAERNAECRGVARRRPSGNGKASDAAASEATLRARRASVLRD